MPATNLLPTPESLTLDEIMACFNTDETALAYLETLLWPNGPVCPHCENADASRIWKLKHNAKKEIRLGLHECADCGKQFRVTVGTIFEDSKIPLRKWLVAFYMICSSKKGISSLQLQRNLDLGSYRTALFMTHRIRYALTNPAFGAPLKGDVEVDETFVGGKEKRGVDLRTGKKNTGFSKKTPVVALVERGGEKRSIVMERLSAPKLAQAIKENVAEGSRVHTDESRLYKKMDPAFEHHTSNHGKGKYVVERDGVKSHTNTLESSFGLLKRGVYGTFHSISKKHLHRYVGEFDFRWNTRKQTDGQRTVAAVKQAKGKRLTLKPLQGAK